MLIEIIRGSTADTTVVNVGYVVVKIVESAAEASDLRSSNIKLHEPLAMLVKLMMAAVV